MTLKIYLDVVYRFYSHENTFEDSQEHILKFFSYIRPFLADPGHESHRPKSQKSLKNRKNQFFQKSIYCDIVSGNMNFGRKRVLWTLQSTQKPYIDLPTQYGSNFLKLKKIVFLIPKIMIKNFPKSIFPADESRPPNRYWGMIHPIGALKAL